ncbi:hypothetical protein ACMHYJ_05320 [Castellaniella hirudinis]|uniref:hypothetical protein n=1 Tax=Castellaniella hirudinis TaxID=1144617 RepID=UPI0039C163A4
MPNPTPLDNLLRPTYKVRLPSGEIVHKQPCQMTDAELDAAIAGERAIAAALQRQADALQVYAEGRPSKVQIGPEDC